MKAEYEPPFEKIELSNDEVIKVRPEQLMADRQKEIVKTTDNGPTVTKERVFIRDFPYLKAEMLGHLLDELDRDGSFDGETYWSDWW